MTADHFEAVLDTILRRQPYRPFTIVVHGDHRYEIDHPRGVIVRNGVAVFLAPTGIPVWFDHESVTQIIDALAEEAF